MWMACIIRLLLMTFLRSFRPGEAWKCMYWKRRLFRVRNKTGDDLLLWWTGEAGCDEEGEANRRWHDSTDWEISPDEFAQFIGPNMRKQLMRIEQGRSYPAAAGILYGQEYVGQAGVHHRQPPYRAGRTGGNSLIIHFNYWQFFVWVSRW